MSTAGCHKLKRMDKPTEEDLFSSLTPFVPQRKPNFDGEQEIESRFECPICLQCLNNPVLTTCGHRFCSECIHMWLQNKGSCCPVDNRPLSINTDLFPDNFTRREIQALESNSNTRDSTSEVPIIECTNKGVGCTSTFSTNEELKMHLETHMQHHISLLSTAFKDLSSFLEDKPMDPKAQEAATLWEPDAKGKSAQTDWHGLVRSLYERIVLLEQQNREQAIQIENMKLQINSSRNDIVKICDDLGTVHCNGTYIWTITNFSDKVKAQVWTRGFYTSPKGYKFCARLNLCQYNKNILALNIHLMKSEHDSCLKWPFSGRIKFTLVNVNMKLNKEDIMAPEPGLLAFQKPLTDINTRGFGYPEYITLAELSGGHLINDCVTILIRIESAV